MSQNERESSLDPVIRLESLAKRSLAPGAAPTEAIVEELRELRARLELVEQERWASEDFRSDLQTRFTNLEAGVRSLSGSLEGWQRETEAAMIEVAESLRELFEDFHHFKHDVNGLAAHVDRWTSRLEALTRCPPVSWIRALRRKR